MRSIISRCLLFVFCLAASIGDVVADEDVYTMQRLIAEGWSISEPLHVEEVEKGSLIEIKKAKETIPDLPLVPFGFENDSWIGFKALTKEREAIYLISAPESDWKQLRGTQGYAIIRNEKVVYYFRTLVN